MSLYQITLIGEDEARVEAARATIEHSAKIVETKNLGERELAYPLKKRTVAYFGNWFVEASKAAIGGLERALRGDQNIFRFIIVSRKGLPQPPREPYLGKERTSPRPIPVLETKKTTAPAVTKKALPEPTQPTGPKKTLEESLEKILQE